MEKGTHVRVCWDLSSYIGDGKNLVLNALSSSVMESKFNKLS